MHIKHMNKMSEQDNKALRSALTFYFIWTQAKLDAK